MGGAAQAWGAEVKLVPPIRGVYASLCRRHHLTAGSCSEIRAAGGGKRDSNLTYIRHVPKFLQSHAHLLGKKGDDEPAVAALSSKRHRDSDSDGGEDDDKVGRVC